MRPTEAQDNSSLIVPVIQSATSRILVILQLCRTSSTFRSWPLRPLSVLGRVANRRNRSKSGSERSATLGQHHLTAGEIRSVMINGPYCYLCYPSPLAALVTT